MLDNAVMPHRPIRQSALFGLGSHATLQGADMLALVLRSKAAEIPGKVSHMGSEK
jgi:hypothetical protein